MIRAAQPPKVHIRPDAERHILEHGRNVFIRPSPRHGCCGGTAAVPVIDLGQPRFTSEYHITTIENVAVYVHKEIVHSESLTIGIGGIGKWKKLWIKGAEMTM